MDSQIVKNTWNRYGKEEPFWSVITNTKFKQENINQKNLDEFFLSGKHDAEFIKSKYKKYYTHENPKILDFGCGVGRILSAWANPKLADGCDISASHLETAKKYCIHNTLHLVEPGQCPKGYDIIYSLITLQHCRPNLIKQCVISIIHALNTNGLALLHIPYFIARVHSSDTNMEMNYITQEEVNTICKENGVKILDIDESRDMCGGNIKNCVYIIQKLKS
jgi:2-polyprenyl-3-methyl-5-hydroxy-6-metoxy-1,4-benzoquinol methylase